MSESFMKAFGRARLGSLVGTTSFRIVSLSSNRKDRIGNIRCTVTGLQGFDHLREKFRRILIEEELNLSNAGAKNRLSRTSFRRRHRSNVVPVRRLREVLFDKRRNVYLWQAVAS